MLSPTDQAKLTDLQKRTLGALTLKMAELGLSAQPLTNVSEGPVITVYRFVPQPGTRVSQIEALADDFSVALGREVFVKRMPGETSVSIAVPNEVRKDVDWKPIAGEVWKAANRPDWYYPIPLGLGVNYLGYPVVEDLSQLPHLLVAGTTGGGKSVLLNGMLASLVYALPSTKLRVALSDTKTVEFGHFIGIPHLLFPPATSPLATLEQIDWLNEESKNRLAKFAKVGAKNLSDYNSRMHPLPRILLMIDEVGVVLNATGKLGYDRLLYLASQSRASGIHAIIATQRPDAKIIDGAIKANFPARLSFRLPTVTDSRVILDTGGAEHLMMQGDMLYQSSIKPGLQRLHAPYTKEQDVKDAVEAAIHRE